MLPSDAELKPLYDAALAYGKASVAEKDKYSALSKKMGHEKARKTDEVKRLTAAKDRLCRAMEAIREQINNKYPKLNLPYAAAHVGWTGEVEGYIKRVEDDLKEHVSNQWSAKYKVLIESVRERMKSFPEVPFVLLQVNDIVFCSGWDENAIYTITRITPSRRKVFGTCSIRKINKQLGKQYTYKKIDQDMMNTMMQMHNSRKTWMAKELADR